MWELFACLCTLKRVATRCASLCNGTCLCSQYSYFEWLCLHQSGRVLTAMLAMAASVTLLILEDDSLPDVTSSFTSLSKSCNTVDSYKVGQLNWLQVPHAACLFCPDTTHLESRHLNICLATCLWWDFHYAVVVWPGNVFLRLATDNTQSAVENDTSRQAGP